MKAFEIQLYPYKEHPEIIKDLFGYHFNKPVDSLFPLFDYISDPVMETVLWEEKFFIIQKGNLFGVVKDDGSIVIPPTFVQVVPNGKGMFLLLNTKYKWGLQDVQLLTCHHKALYKKGNPIPCEYDEIGDCSEGFYVVKQNGKYGYAPSYKDNLNICPEFEDARPFHEGIAAVKKEGKWGFIDKTLTEITPFVYDKVSDFDGGKAEVYKDGNKHIIDFEGNDISKIQKLNDYDYEYHGTCHEGLYAVTKEDKLGFTNIHGNITIPIEYKFTNIHGNIRTPIGCNSLTMQDTIPYFSEGFACVRKECYWGYIDKRNRVVFPFVLDSYQPIVNGIAEVSDGFHQYHTVTIKHFNDYLHGKKIPFRLERPRCLYREYDDYSSRWTHKELEEAYLIALEDDLRNEWNID